MIPIVRTNLAPNPRVGVGITGWGADTVAITRVAQGGGWAASVPVAASTGKPTYFYPPNMSDLPAGGFYGARVTVKGPAGRRVKIQLHSGPGYLSAPIETTLTGVPQEVVIVPTSAKVTAVILGLYAYPVFASGWVSGETLTMTNVLIEEVTGVGVVPGTYFDGATMDTPGVDYAWVGVADASPSTKTTSQIVLTNWCVNPCLGTNRTGWVSDGTFTRVAIGDRWAAQSTAPFSYLAGPATSYPVGLWWAGRVTVNGPAGRRVRLVLHDSVTYLTASSLVDLTGDPIEVDMPPLYITTALYPRVILYPYGGVVAGDLITLTDFLLEQVSGAGEHAGPYFDGSTADVPGGTTYAWTGTAHASISTAVPPAITAGVALVRAIAAATHTTRRITAELASAWAAATATHTTRRITAGLAALWAAATGISRRNVTLTVLTGPTGHPFTPGDPTGHPMSIASPVAHPFRVTDPRS